MNKTQTTNLILIWLRILAYKLIDIRSKKIRSSILGLFFVCITTSITAQNFKGVIKNEKGEEINNCYVVIIDKETNQVLEYTVPKIDGNYHITITDNNVSSVIIKCQGLSYTSKFKEVVLKKEIKLYKNDFILNEEINELDEVIIVSDIKKIKIKKDTVVYNVSKFKKANDRKIINVLKNMPGIRVNEKTGQIIYKGKPIETLLLDGDNLFGKNYSIGARNISSEIVDKVEAIEDYHNNRLKKGLTKSNKVVINLKFKKKKIKFSGEIALGLGIDNHLINANTINLSNKIKGFGVFNFNNVSMNQTSFEKETYISENRSELSKYSIDFLKESSVKQESNFPRSYINNIKYGTYSNLIKLSKKIKFRNNLSVFKDIKKYGYSSKNQIIINREEINISNKIQNTQEPFYFKMDNTIIYDISPLAVLKYNNRIVNKKDDFYQENIQNQNLNYNTQLKSVKKYFDQELNFSSKISSNELLEMNLLSSNDKMRQDVTFLGEAIRYNNEVFNEELVDSKRFILGAYLKYLRKIKRNNIELMLQHKYDKEDSKFVFNNNGNNNAYSFRNEISNLIVKYNYNITKKIKISEKIELGRLKRKINQKIDNQIITKKDLYFNTNTKLSYKISKKNILSIGVSNKTSQLSNRYMYTNPLLIDTRAITTNNPSLNLKKDLNIYANFSHYDLLQQSNFSLLASLNEVKNTYMSKQNISEDISIITYFQTPLTKKDINILATTSFFIDKINTKITINTNANFNTYYNLLNQNRFQSVWSSVYTTNFRANSAFKGFFNYKANMNYSYIENKQENSQAFLNSIINTKLEFNLKISKKAYANITNNLILPRGIKVTENQLFIDFSFNYISKRKMEYFILAKNLLNRSTYDQVNNTEFSKSIVSKNIFKRYVVIGLNYSF